jgi:hypothetical protein
MQALRLSLVGMVTLALVAGVSGVVMAQDVSEVASGPTYTWVTAIESACSAEGGTSDTQGGVERHRELLITCADTWSDPRVSGTKTVVYNDDCFGEAPCLYWGTQEIAGPDGTWTGWFNGTLDPERGATGYIVMTGTGAYEGLTFVSHAMGPFNEPGVAYGLIYEGAPPPGAATAAAAGG